MIEKVPSFCDQYSLTRFFAKSSILPDKLYQTLNKLEGESPIQVIDIKYTVKHYAITKIGHQILEENYSLNSLKEFLHEVELTDFFIKILESIEVGQDNTKELN